MTPGSGGLYKYIYHGSYIPRFTSFSSLADGLAPTRTPTFRIRNLLIEDISSLPSVMGSIVSASPTDVAGVGMNQSISFQGKLPGC